MVETRFYRVKENENDATPPKSSSGSFEIEYNYYSEEENDPQLTGR